MTKVFVIDGDTGVLELISILLTGVGFQVSFCTKGEVLLQVRQLQPDVILLDHFYSGAGEENLCKQLKSTNECRHIPVLLMSTLDNAATAAANSGAENFINKPFDIDVFVQKVQDMAKLAELAKC